jgi:hypothetical protein
MIAFGRLVLIAVAALTVACGQKGPPLAPLHLVPAPPPNVSVGRIGSDARLRFDVPSTNQNGPGPLALDRIEIYAATVAPGAVRPANRELLTAKYRVGTIPIKPPPVEGEAPPPTTPPDTRPSAGERSTFVEALTEERLKPVFTTLAPKPPAPILPGALTPIPTDPTEPGAEPAVPVAAPAPPPAGRAARGAAQTAPAAVPTLPGVPTPIPTAPAEPVAATTPGAAAAPPATPAPPPALPVAPIETPSYAARIYAVRGMTKSGRPGPPSTRVELPLVAPPAAPPPVAAAVTEKAIVLTWPPPKAEGVVTYNIYKVGAADPITSVAASEGTFERAGVEFGTEECFVLRAVQKVAAADVESDLSTPVCVTPRDTFPPAAPKGLSVVAGTGTINLGWDANTEADLAGYLVLRGEAPGDTLQPLTPAPITGTSYEDKTARPGVRYAYAIVAVDKATPPNRSAPSARVEETAR